MKEFNTTAVCIPEKHYMVDISDTIAAITDMVDAGKYFTINRARQYGKTTTLNALKKSLQPKYVVISLDFQNIGAAGFKTEQSFVQEMSRIMSNLGKTGLGMPDDVLGRLNDFSERLRDKARMGEMFDTLADWCDKSEKGIVLLIDEVDSASNNQVFLDFLAQLRNGYIRRDTDNIATFQSVILAGVTDVRHMRSKIRTQDQHKVNSPWNIAADFDLDMSFSAEGIKGMLEEYESDHHSGMDIMAMAQLIRDYTGGYPFLVSRICQLIDKDVKGLTGDLTTAWTMQGMDEAVKLILQEDNTLFRSMIGKLDNYPGLREMLKSILMEGTRYSYSVDQEPIVQMQMYGFIKNENNAVRISNRIFETRLYNLFLSDEEIQNNGFYKEGDRTKNQFVQDGVLNMRLIMERFVETFHQIYGPLEDRFLEKDGRELFLLYLKPIINGTGNYYIEAQTRDQKRTDVIVDYLGKQYIIELKIWHGERYHADGEKQISAYLDYFGLTTGYMLSFNFNKQKETGLKQVHIGEKLLYEATV